MSKPGEGIYNDHSVLDNSNAQPEPRESKPIVEEDMVDMPVTVSATPSPQHPAVTFVSDT